jgi:hypothetical protein
VRVGSSVRKKGSAGCAQQQMHKSRPVQAAKQLKAHNEHVIRAWVGVVVTVTIHTADQTHFGSSSIHLLKCCTAVS